MAALPSRPETGGRFAALDSLRGLAALVVVVNHCLNLFPVIGGPSGAVDPVLAGLLRSPLSLLWDGRGAVAVFFVLSGFVLALPWVRGSGPRYGAFVIRRFCRIYLPYAVAVAAAMGLATALAPLRPVAISLWFDTANWTEPVGLAAVADHVLMLGGHNTFDNAVWSLNHEMRLSLVFPLLLWPIRRFGWMGAALLAVGLYGAAGVITHFLGWHGVPAEVAATVRFAACFILGATLAGYADRLAAVPRRGLGWLALGAGLLLLWASREPAVMAAASGLLILSIILPGPVRAALLRPWPLALGRISYSLYLVHLPIILSAVHLLHAALPLPVIALGSGLLSLAVAFAFHRWVEAPANRLGRRLAAA